MGAAMGMVGQVAGLAGSFGGGGGGNQASPITFDATGYANKANSFLDEALGSAIDYSEKFTDRAADVARTQEQIAQDRNAPFKLAGMTGLDKYMDSMATSRPEMGSFLVAQALEDETKRNAAMKGLRDVADDIYAKQPNMLSFGGYTDPYKTVRSAGNPAEVREKMERMYPGSQFTEQTVRLANRNRDSGFQGAGDLGIQHTGAESYAEKFASVFPQVLQEGRYTGGGVISPEFRDMTQKLLGESNRALSNYDETMRYWTPEKSSIAKGWNTGLFSDAQWRDV